MRFASVSCCVCHADMARPYCIAIDRLHGVPGEFQYVRCAQCHVIYQNPQVIPDDIQLLYPSEYAPWSAPPNAGTLPSWKRKLRDAITITGLPSFVREQLNQESSLLDVGCGSGKFMARIAADHPRCRVEGIDFSPEAAAAVEGIGYKVHVGTLPDIACRLPQYDVITMWWYLEHLHDPQEVLRICSRLLKPGGYLCCAVPKENSAGRFLFRSNWYHLDPPRHLWIFSPKTLGELMKRSGFEVKYVKQDYSAWGILGSLQYLSRSRQGTGATWVENPLLKLAFRPLAAVQGLVHLGDTFAMYAQPLAGNSDP